MKKSILVLFICAACFFNQQVSLCNATILEYLSGQTFGEIVVFGDSLSDNGNRYAASGHLDPADHSYWQGRFSNGPVWVEYLAQYMQTPLNDMAVGWATSGEILNNQILPYTLSNVSQGDSLYIVQSGNNDFIQGDPLNPTVWIAPAIQNIGDSLTALYADGARNFVVANAPDYGLTPYANKAGNPAVNAGMTGLASAFNNALAGVIGQFDAMPGTTVYTMDFFGLTQMAVSNPAMFGFTNVTEGYLYVQSGDADEFLFYDDIHPTTATHRLLIPEPATLVMLLAGSGLMLRRRRK